MGETGSVARWGCCHARTGLCEQQGARDGISKLQNNPYATSAVDSTYQRHLRRLCSLQLPRVLDSSTPGGLSILHPDSWFLIPECPMSITALSLSGLPAQARTRGISLRNSLQ